MTAVGPVLVFVVGVGNKLPKQIYCERVCAVFVVLPFALDCCRALKVSLTPGLIFVLGKVGKCASEVDASPIYTDDVFFFGTR